MCFDNYFQSLQAGGEGRTEQITLRLILEIILFYVTLQYNLLMHCFFPERLRWLFSFISLISMIKINFIIFLLLGGIE